jgi:hypothetical protein
MSITGIIRKLIFGKKKKKIIWKKSAHNSSAADIYVIQHTTLFYNISYASIKLAR